MRYENVCIEALDYVLPDSEVTTASIERMLSRVSRRLGLGSGFIEALTGVRARRFWDADVTPSLAATRAAERVLKRTGIPRADVQALISTSVCKDFLEPSTASLVHGNLGLSTECLNFDLGNACLGFVMGMATVANMIELRQIETGMVVAGEGSRAVTSATVKTLLRPGVVFADLVDNLATLTLGSGAVAMILTHRSRSRSGHRLLGGVTLAATEYNHLCVGTEAGMKTEPAKLLSEGVRLAARTWERLRAELGIDAADEYILHQVGRANHDALTSALALPPDRALRVYADLGNVGAAGVPLTLAMAVEEGRVTAGTRVALMGIGSGLNCAMMGVEW